VVVAEVGRTARAIAARISGHTHPPANAPVRTPRDRRGRAAGAS
jgi:hypothetical protein